jgi:hypothetical protein
VPVLSGAAGTGKRTGATARRIRHCLWNSICILPRQTSLFAVGDVAFWLGGQRVVREFSWLKGAGWSVQWFGAIFILVAVCAAGGARADDDVMKTIVVFGDSQAQGIAGGLQRVLLDDPRYKVLNRSHPGAALVHSDTEWLAPVVNFVAKDKAQIAIVMFGANDRLDMRDEGSYVHFRTDAWRDTYAKRADKILTALTGAGLKVIWCGNPIARSPTYSDDMKYINDIYATEVAKFGGEFLPLWTIIADNQGQFTAYGPDRSGVTERMRNDDGIHFTAAGYEIIAERVISMLPSLQANGH